jgi:hypothetical protein
MTEPVGYAAELAALTHVSLSSSKVEVRKRHAVTRGELNVCGSEQTECGARTA